MTGTLSSLACLPSGWASLTPLNDRGEAAGTMYVNIGHVFCMLRADDAEPPFTRLTGPGVAAIPTTNVTARGQTTVPLSVYPHVDVVESPEEIFQQLIRVLS